MRCHVLAGTLAFAVLGTAPMHSAAQPRQSSAATETRIPIGKTSLYARVIGQEQPVIVLHGGPAFDHSYLLPDFDRFADRFRLIYYDQRGRGQSAEYVDPQDVTLASELDDLDKVRQHFNLDSVILIGHSWGTVLALEYALRYPTRVSQVVLMNPAPASASDRALMRRFYLEKFGPAMDRQREILASAAYQQGDPGTVMARWRIHFRAAFQRTDAFEQLMAAMTAAFFRQGKDGIVKAMAVERRLHGETWDVPTYDLVARVRELRVPTLVIAGDRDFIPVEVAQHIAQAIPGSRLVTIRNCGHFGYLECAGEVRAALDAFFIRDAPR